MTPAREALLLMETDGHPAQVAGEAARMEEIARANGAREVRRAATEAEAKQMLETGDDSIEAIANEVGYEDTSFFGRLFRRKVGVAPGEYRLRIFHERALPETLTAAEREAIVSGNAARLLGL